MLPPKVDQRHDINGSAQPPSKQTQSLPGFQKFFWNICNIFRLLAFDIFLFILIKMIKGEKILIGRDPFMLKYLLEKQLTRIFSGTEILLYIQITWETRKLFERLPGFS